MNVLVTGGAGFIGSHVVDALVSKGETVTVIDNLSSGRKEFIAKHFTNPRFHFVHGDLSDVALLQSVMRGQDFVWHLAAKADVRTYSREDFEKDVSCTSNVLAAMKENGVRKIAFSSSSTVYGDARNIPTPEHAQLQPISIYGESKVACEARIAEFCEKFGGQSWLFRFANIIGERGTHGVIFDFINKLRRNPGELEILGDGRQSKSYMLVQDCVAGMAVGVEKSNGKINILNLGCEDWISVRRIAEIVSEEIGILPEFHFTGGERGWVGDVPKMQLSIDKAKSLGWKPTLKSEGAVREATNALLSV